MQQFKATVVLPERLYSRQILTDTFVYFWIQFLTPRMLYSLRHVFDCKHILWSTFIEVLHLSNR